jgi:hypothetical protein
VTSIAWTLVTGEFPPDPGGVSDYTGQLAAALRAAGDRVRVWTGAGASVAGVDEAGGIAVHRAEGAFRLAALRRLERLVDGDPLPRRVLVQYVPHAFGLRAMNLPFARWVGSVREAPVDLMFHEVAFPWSARPSHVLLAAATRLMARLAGRGAARVFVSTEAWIPVLRSVGVGGAVALPIPSNLPPAPTPVPAPRRAAPAFGHFGTFGGTIAPLLEPALREALERVPGSCAVLVGRGSGAFATGFARRHPHLAGRLEPSDDVPPAVAAERLASCDILVQPYPDGATTRRTSLMAGLAAGRPVVTNRGPLTEAFWDGLGAMVLAPDPVSIGRSAAALAADPDRCAALGARARLAHDAHFSVEQTVQRLRELPPRPAAPRCGSVIGPR